MTDTDSQQMDDFIRAKAGRLAAPVEPEVDPIEAAVATLSGWVESGLITRDDADAFAERIGQNQETAE